MAPCNTNPAAARTTSAIGRTRRTRRLDFQVDRPGSFQVAAEIAAGTGKFEIVLGEQKISGTAPDTGDYTKFRSVNLAGTLEIAAPGKYTIDRETRERRLAANQSEIPHTQAGGKLTIFVSFACFAVNQFLVPCDYQLVQLASGARTHFSSRLGEKMHPGLGPRAEADLLYVRSSTSVNG